MDHRQIKIMKVVLLASSLASLFVLISAAYEENFRGEWRDAQEEYRRLLLATADSEPARQAARSFAIEHKQLYLAELNGIDRCTTCHLGVENPAMAGAEQPLRRHPDDLLELHPPDQFGCTVCHQGRGRATTKEEAHGRHEDGTPMEFMSTPILLGRAVVTSCGRCHNEVDLYGGETDLFAGSDAAEARARAGSRITLDALNRTLRGAEWLAASKRLVVESGCLGCHKYRGRGGVLGPDLTYVGDKTKHDFDFTHVKGEHTVEQWLFEHFKYPREVSPGTLMPDMGLSNEQARELALYMMSLHRRDAPASHIPAPRMASAAAEEEVGGETLYGMFCSACHGAEGLGTTVRAGLWPGNVDSQDRDSGVPSIVTEHRANWDIMVPSLNHADTLAVASDDYLRQIISTGRHDTNMLGWGKAGGGLDPHEIDAIVGYLRGRAPPPPPLESISADRGDRRRGNVLYRARCAGCHGNHGEGGIGVALNSPSFLAVASDGFLRDAIVFGRPNTAMPAWTGLSAGEVSDILAFLRSWQAKPADRNEVLTRLAEGGKPSRRALRIGKSLYRSNCGTCHGTSGEGAIGPSLNNENFLEIVDGAYLYDAVVNGRPGTAMPSWKHLSSDDVVDIINYVRNFHKGEHRELQPYRAHGDWDRGRIMFRGACASCHGTEAEGATGPQLSNPVFLASASDAMLREWISYGKPGTPMLPFLKGRQGLAELSESQIEDVITYLRRFEGAPRVATARPGMGIVPRGAAVYSAACASCHGDRGQGATGSGLSNPRFLSAASDGFVEATIVLGRDGTEMLPMGKGSQGNIELSADDISDVVAFIRSWEREPPIEGIPARYVVGAEIEAGGNLFQGQCAGCHGTEGRGGWAPALNNRDFLAAATDGFLHATIVRGRQGTAMRAFGRGGGGISELSSEQIDNIVAYIRGWAAPENRPAASPEGEGVAGVAGLDIGR